MGRVDTPSLSPTKNVSVESKGFIAGKCAKGALILRSWSAEGETKGIGKNAIKKIERGGYPIPGVLQSVRKRLIGKELEETLV